MPSEASKPSPDLLRLIANNLREMVMAYDMERNLVFVNPAVETLTGYSPQELEKENFILWVHPEDQPRMLAHWDALFQGKGFHEEEYRLVAKDGRIKWVVSSWTPLFDDHGRQVGVQGREFDITQRKLAETALRHSADELRADHERYRALFENSPFPMWEEDFSEVRRYLESLRAGVPDLLAHLEQDRLAIGECVRRVRVLDVNRAAREFYGAQTKQELLAGLERMFDEQAFDIFRDEMVTLAGGEPMFQAEFTARTLKGEERRVDMIVCIVDSARDDWSRVIVSFFDVTDRKRLEEQFVQSQKMESLGRLAGGIAHDFNNLLTVINGYTDWILADLEPGSPWRARLAEVRTAGEQCAALTQQLLAFSRKQISRPGPVNLNHLIRESETMLGRILGDDIEVRTALCPDVGLVQVDKAQMNQVLLNLAANAREAMPGGGVLTIGTANLDEPARVLLEIRDTGLGMDEATRRHLFEPFFTTKRDRNNTGLGLATVFGIVSHCGGHIEVQSEPGEGAVFRIEIPRMEPPDSGSRIPAPQAAAAPRGSGTILVVEDREEVRNLTCRMLEELGYRTVAAASGLEALQIALAHPGGVPILLTDVVMPGMNGRELAERLLSVYPGMKTIFMSGYTDRILTDTAALDSSSAYLQKPFTLAQLAEILRQVGG